MIYTLIKSSRLIHWIPIVLNSVVSALICNGGIINGVIIGLQISCIASFSFVINDALDAKIDRLNSEKRMSELNTRHRVLISLFSLLYLVTTFALSILFTPSSLTLMIMLTVMLVGYNILFKRILFLGNIIAAVTLMAPIGIPYMLYSTTVNPFLLLIIASGVLYNFSREIILDIGDIKGDSQNGRHTFPIIIGTKNSIRLSFILYGIAFIILIISPYSINLPLIPFKFLGQTLISFIFLALFVFNFSKLKPLIKMKTQDITFEKLQQFVSYSRATIIIFPLVLLIYYFAQ